ncbi:hypothetical protein KSP40_PGU016768 [Platanthera guangdongensis]|uniref:Uncharacterized protein n=1 Tax=Platanthera guangdongensis TaxID=2320717 RepID=A0ABR2N1W6_9ASPA
MGLQLAVVASSAGGKPSPMRFRRREDMWEENLEVEEERKRLLNDRTTLPRNNVSSFSLKPPPMPLPNSRKRHQRGLQRKAGYVVSRRCSPIIEKQTDLSSDVEEAEKRKGDSRSKRAVV